MNGAPRLTVNELNKSMNKGKHKVNTTKINRKRRPDSGIEPETTDLPGKHANLYTARTST